MPGAGGGTGTWAAARGRTAAVRETSTRRGGMADPTHAAARGTSTRCGCPRDRGAAACGTYGGSLRNWSRARGIRSGGGLVSLRIRLEACGPGRKPVERGESADQAASPRPRRKPSELGKPVVARAEASRAGVGGLQSPVPGSCPGGGSCGAGAEVCDQAAGLRSPKPMLWLTPDQAPARKSEVPEPGAETGAHAQGGSRPGSG